MSDRPSLASAEVLASLGVPPQRVASAPGIPSHTADSLLPLAKDWQVRDVIPFLRFLYRFNTRKLDAVLRQRLDGNVGGYCYAVRRKGHLELLSHRGWAVLPDETDAGLPWAFHVSMEVASISKFITAIAMTRLLRSHGICFDAPIWPWLPVYWARGNIGAVTFRHLLTHRSGLGHGLIDAGDHDYVTARHQIALGSVGVGEERYKNVNFAILRVLLATVGGFVPIDHDVEHDFFWWPFGTREEQVDRFWDAATTAAYVNYVNSAVFTPAEIGYRDLESQPISALAYPFPPSGKGVRRDDTRFAAGSSGWYLSLGELLRLARAFRTGAIINRTAARRMLEDGFGVGIQSTDLGPVYEKNGGANFGSTAMLSRLYLLPGDVEFAIFTNSPPTGDWGKFWSWVDEGVRAGIESVFS